jgi:hypothetical protein
MKPTEVARVQKYLRQTFGNDQITLTPPTKPEAPCELSIGDEFLAVIYRDDDDGEISFSLHMTILDEDMPAD